MIDKIKQKARETAKFVETHPTLTACVVTAAITRKIVKTATASQMMNMIADEVYQYGYKYGELEEWANNVDLQNNVLMAFVNERALDDDVREFVRQIHQ